MSLLNQDDPCQARPAQILMVLVVLLAMILIAAGTPATAATVVHSDSPQLPPQTIHCEEIWRLGGDSDEVMFGLMVGALEDAQGNVYLMDQQLCQVTVVSQAGEIVGILGSQGEGPGEVREPMGMALLSDGTLALAEQFPGKLVKLNLDGTPAGTVTLGRGQAAGGFTMLTGVGSRGGVLLAAALFQAPIENGQSRLSYLARLSDTGEELLRYCEHTVNLDFHKAHFIERDMAAPFLVASTLGPDGCVYTLHDRNAYMIDVYAPDGGLVRTISRDFTPLPRTQREKDRWNALFEVQARSMDFTMTWEVEEFEQTVRRLHVDDDGRLWVQHARSDEDQPEGIFLTYDLFDPQGHWLREVSFAIAANPAYDGLIFLNGDLLLLVKGLILAELTATGSQGAVFDEQEGGGDLMEVICLRMAG